MSKVTVIRSFADSRRTYIKGEVIELPPNVDWIKAKLVKHKRKPRGKKQ